ncbi:hypothetical protein MMC17_007821 [Xylographa soralifera]|nr:hypothetical protein [Xylographa soralifera]
MLPRLKCDKRLCYQPIKLQRPKTFETCGLRTIVTTTQPDSEVCLGTTQLKTSYQNSPKITQNSPTLRAEPSQIELIRDAIFESKSGVSRPFKRNNRSISFVSTDLPAIFRHIQGLENLSSIQRLTWAHRIVTQCLRSPKDSIQLLSVLHDFTSLLVPSAETPSTEPSTEELAQRAYGLRIYNSAVHALQRQHVPLNSDIICWGIRVAAEARSTAAIQYYLLISTRKNIDIAHDQAQATFQALKHWVQSETFQGWEGLRQKQQLLFNLTGRESQEIGAWHEAWQKCLHQMSGSGPDGLTYDYLFILQKLSGTQTVFNEWLNFKESQLWREFSQATGEKATASKVIVDSFVQVLVDAKDVEWAWKVIEDSGIKLGDLSTNSLSALLDHPEFIRRWDDGMDEHLLRKYEETIRRIEEAMGIHWSGGEDGYHTLQANLACEDDYL